MLPLPPSSSPCLPPSLPPSLPPPSSSSSSLGAVWYSSGRLAVGDVSGRLALWGVGGGEGGGGGGGEGEGGGGGERGPPTVSLQTELELQSAIFSLAFDHHMKLVSVVTKRYSTVPSRTYVKFTNDTAQ